MIENENQLHNTRRIKARFEMTLAAVQVSNEPVDPILHKARIDALQSMIDDLGQQIRNYQNGTNPQCEGYGLVGVWRNLKHAARSILHPPPYEEHGRNWRG